MSTRASETRPLCEHCKYGPGYPGDRRCDEVEFDCCGLLVGHGGAPFDWVTETSWPTDPKSLLTWLGAMRERTEAAQRRMRRMALIVLGVVAAVWAMAIATFLKAI